MTAIDTATAHTAWNERWKSEEGRAAWIDPAVDVRWCARREWRRGARRVLDLGCGVGRHALYFAALGFDVSAIDGSQSGIAHLREEAEAAGLRVRAQTGLMTHLPYDDGAFDYVLAFNVIYHGDGDVVRRSIAEITRILQKGGAYQGTMLTKRNANFGRGREVSPDTYVADADAADADGDKSHPHFYCDAQGLAALFSDFDIESLHAREHEKPGSWHWHMVARRHG